MKPLVIVSVLILGGLAGPVRAEPLQAIETFKYAFRLSGAVAQARQDEAFTGIDSAKGKAVVDAAMDQFDIDELARRVAEHIADALSEQEAEACVDFIRSSVGADFLEAMEPARDQAEAQRRLRTLPDSHRAPIEGFLRSACYQKAAQLLVSPAVMRAHSDYGAELVCAQYREQEPAAHAQAVRKGYCRS